jgi:phytoene dehydrogenase-like protein
VASASFALVLGAAAHAVGWPVVRGGSQRLADALRAHLESLGGAVSAGAPVRAVEELREASAVLCDVTPRQLLALAPDLPDGYRRRLARFRYGPGVFKMDWALDAPVPWKAAACAQAATVHLGGTLEEIAASESAAWTDVAAERPFVILVQPTLVDPSRAPEGKHTLWAYCHVPNGSDEDMTARIEAQIERFAPGFRDRILARAAHGPAALARTNENLVGGDINGGAANLMQLVARPTLRTPYTTPLRGLYLCSASTPPGGGVHGMCGHLAARTALRRTFGLRDPGSP